MTQLAQHPQSKIIRVQLRQNLVLFAAHPTGQDPAGEPLAMARLHKPILAVPSL